MALNDTPNKLESVWIQRNPLNQFYEQINISGSDLIVYHSSSGEIQADKITDFMSKYGVSGGGSTAKVTSVDTTSGYLGSKIQAGANITITVLNPGANETMSIASAGGAVSDQATLATSSILAYSAWVATGSFFASGSNFASRSLTASYIDSGSGYYSGFGYITGSLLGTASQAISASWAPGGNIDLTTYLSSSWTGSNLSQFSGTASYTQTASLSTFSTNANNIWIDVDSGGDFQPLVFTQFDGSFPDYNVLHKYSASYQPSTNTLRVTNLQGTASWASTASLSLKTSGSVTSSLIQFIGVGSSLYASESWIGYTDDGNYEDFSVLSNHTVRFRVGGTTGTMYFNDELGSSSISLNSSGVYFFGTQAFISSSGEITAPFLHGTSSHAITSSFTLSASHAFIAEAVDVLPQASGLLNVALLGGGTGPCNVMADATNDLLYDPAANTLTVPYVTTTASFAVSASWAPTNVTSSTAVSASYALIASQITVNVTSSNVEYYVPFVVSSGSQTLYIDSSSIYYNPQTNFLTVHYISASAITASLYGTASFAVSASNAVSASYALTTSYASVAQTVYTASTALTSSYFYRASGSGAWRIYVNDTSGDLVWDFS